MNTLGLAQSYVQAHAARGHGSHPVGTSLASLTVSREAGSRATPILRRLVRCLNAEEKPGGVPWTLFDQDLMDVVLADHDLPAKIGKFFPEAYWSEIDTTIGAILRRHPESWTIFEETVETIRRLGGIGHAILVGRGSHLITQGFRNVLHLRLIGSRAKRLAFLVADRGWTQDVAEAYLHRCDRDRRAYVLQHFDRDVSDAHAYSLVLNTDHYSDDAAASLLAHQLQGLEAQLALPAS